MDHFLPAIREEVRTALAAAEADPEDPSANGELGMILHAHQQYAAAETCYRRARGLEPERFRWLYYLGVVQAAQGRHSEAVTSLRDALAVDPAYLPARLKLADSLLETGSLEESGEAYQAAIDAGSKSAVAFYGLGRIQAAAGDLAAAAKSHQCSVELFPKYGMAHYALALAYRRLGEESKSRPHFELAEKHKLTVPPAGDRLIAEIRKRDAGALDVLRTGVNLAEAGKFEEAVQVHIKALEIDPGIAQAHVNLIILYGNLGEPEKAERHYRAAIEINSDLAETHYNYGVLVFEQGELDQAKESFQRALEINPFYAEAHNNLGYLLEREGKQAEAVKHYREAVANKPGYRLAHFHLGRILVNQQKYTEAFPHLRGTLTPEDEQTPTFLYALGAAYARYGDRANALTHLREARKQAHSFGQSQLLASINKDLSKLEGSGAAR
ncbi:MAG: tetratricopeptide repeat protein [bacterium]|nr:tetratricopeptide repeat protein [bacterium]